MSTIPLLYKKFNFDPLVAYDFIGLFAEAPVEGTGAHSGVGGDVVESEVPLRVLLHPSQQGLHGRPLRCGWLFVDDELCLPAVAFQGHHGKAGGVGGHGRVYGVASVPQDLDAGFGGCVMWR